MNCLEYRREILVDPRHAGDEAEEHARSCAACAEFRQHALAMDDSIAQGLRVPVPESLAERVIASTKDATWIAPRQRLSALAASLLLAVALLLGVLVVGRDDPFARACIDFVVDEEANAILTSKTPNPEDLRRVTQALNVSLPSQIGEIHYIGTCPFQGSLIHHVVLITPQGKATLLLLPDRSIDRKALASARGLRSVVKATGKGSVAIIAASERNLERIEGMITRG
jgi:Protein of unknown function (DUF3379)